VGGAAGIVLAGLGADDAGIAGADAVDLAPADDDNASMRATAALGPFAIGMSVGALAAAGGEVEAPVRTGAFA
jgi:hypothetical protein